MVSQEWKERRKTARRRDSLDHLLNLLIKNLLLDLFTLLLKFNTFLLLRLGLPTPNFLRLGSLILLSLTTICALSFSIPLLILTRSSNGSLCFSAAFGQCPAVFFVEFALFDAQEGDADLDAFDGCACVEGGQLSVEGGMERGEV